MRSLDIAATGMQAQQTNVEVISNNIANMTTTGYKRRQAEFQDLIYQNLRRVGSNSSDSGSVVPAGAQVGLGVRTAAIYRINEQGNLQQTSNTLRPGDQRQRLFPGHAALRRDRLYPRRHVRPVAGRPDRHRRRLYGAARHHRPRQRHLGHHQRDRRRCRSTLSGQTAPSTVGTLQLATFPNEAGLDAQGNNLLLQSAASGNPATGTPGSPGFGTVMQGFVETSNVNVVTEITNLITAQRAYEMNSQVITTSDQMLSTLTNMH